MLIKLFLGVVLFFPIAKGFLGSSSIAQVVITSFALCIAILGLLRNWRPLNRATFNILIACSLLILWIFIVSIYTDSPLQRVLSDVGRLVAFLAFLMFGYSEARIDDSITERISDWLIIYGYVSVIFSLLVFVEIAHPLVDLYKGRLSDDVVPFHFYRASGFSGYPTDFSVLLCLMGLIAYRRWKNGKYTPRFFIATAFVLFLGLALSAARGGFLMLFFLLLFELYRLNLKRIILGSIRILFLAVIALGLFYWANKDFVNGKYSGFNYVFNSIDEADDSVLHRFKELEISLEVLEDKRELPVGEERLEPGGLNVIEGFWTHYIIRYGWGGLLLGCFFAISILIPLSRGGRYSFPDALFYWSMAFFLVVAPFSDVLSRLRGLPLYPFLFGLGIGSSKTLGPEKPIHVDQADTGAG